MTMLFFRRRSPLPATRQGLIEVGTGGVLLIGMRFGQAAPIIAFGRVLRVIEGDGLRKDRDRCWIIPFHEFRQSFRIVGRI
jgi:hypothetical protein